MDLDRLTSIDGPLLRLLIPIVVCVVLAMLLSWVLRIVGGRLLDDSARTASLSRAALVGVSAVGVLLGLGRLADPVATDTGLRTSLAGMVGAMPRLTISFILVIVALLVASLVRATIERVVGAVRPALAGSAGALAYWVIVVLVLLIAVEQAGMDVDLLQQLLLLFVAGVVIAGSLGLGLGLRPLLSSIVAGRHVESIVEPGVRVSVGDGDGGRVSGLVVSVGHVSVRLQSDDGALVDVPHTRFLEGSSVRDMS